MKQRINLLITFSTIVLVGLCFIQYYLVKTTYNYKVAQFRLEVKEKLAGITNDYSSVDSTLFRDKDVLYKQLAQKYMIDASIREHLKAKLLQNQFKTLLTQKLQKEFEKEFPNHDLNFAIVLNKFVIYNNQKTDTIYSEKPAIDNRLCGNLSSLKDAFLIRSYVGTTSSSNFKLLTEDSLYVSIKGWEMIVLKRMMLVLTLTVFSVLVLISLFVLTIKALIKQKKIAVIKTDFINNITHELKTPLTTLAVSTKILERKDIQENKVVFNQIIETINRQNNRLQDLIDQVISNSLENNQIQLHKETIKTNSFLASLIHDFRIANPTITISTAFSSNETQIVVDQFHFTTAITNVLENAVKYGSQTIIVKTFVKNNMLSIAIEDDGIGIAKEKQSLLFDKFYRIEKGNLHNTKGLGLGLYYVNQIIKAHQGKINLISDLGKGSQFTLSIPY